MSEHTTTPPPGWNRDNGIQRIVKIILDHNGVISRSLQSKIDCALVNEFSHAWCAGHRDAKEDQKRSLEHMCTNAERNGYDKGYDKGYRASRDEAASIDKTRQGDISAALHAAEVAEKDLRDYKEAEAVRHNARESYDNAYDHGYDKGYTKGRDDERNTLDQSLKNHYEDGVKDGLASEENHNTVKARHQFGKAIQDFISDLY